MPQKHTTQSTDTKVRFINASMGAFGVLESYYDSLGSIAYCAK